MVKETEPLWATVAESGERDPNQLAELNVLRLLHLQLRSARSGQLAREGQGLGEEERQRVSR